MKKYIIFPALSLSLLFISTSVYASTSIGTSINTAGNLTVTGNSALGSQSAINGGSLSPGWDSATLDIEQHVDLSGYVVGIVGFTEANPPSGTTNSVEGIDFGGASAAGNSQTFSLVSGASFAAEHQGSGTITEMDPIRAYLFNDSTGHIIDSHGIWVSSPSNVGGGTIDEYTAFYSGDANVTGITNPYYSWFDSRGVHRCKEDSTFNSVGQSICTLYNPQFTKYTAGATNYERIVSGQWNSNVAQIGTENGGTGSPRALAFMTASTTRMTIGANGNVGIGVTSPTTALQVATSTSNATSTLTIGKTAQNKGSCLELFDAAGTAVYAYVAAGASTFSLSATSCK